MIWNLIARFLARPAVTAWLIRRAERTPYKHITSPDGSSVYMYRFWLFNPYPAEDGPDLRGWLMRRLPSLRLHHIMREDDDHALHDHPWNARTFILRGWYAQIRPIKQIGPLECGVHDLRTSLFTSYMNPGETTRLNFGEYHRIITVPHDGVWTLFMTGKKRGTWGFLVDGHKVPWREYLAATGDSMLPKEPSETGKVL